MPLFTLFIYLYMKPTHKTVYTRDIKRHNVRCWLICNCRDEPLTQRHKSYNRGVTTDNVISLTLIADNVISRGTRMTPQCFFLKTGTLTVTVHCLHNRRRRRISYIFVYLMYRPMRFRTTFYAFLSSNFFAFLAHF